MRLITRHVINVILSAAKNLGSNLDRCTKRNEREMFRFAQHDSIYEPSQTSPCRRGLMFCDAIARRNS
jgi:hypothetical protein